MSQPHRMERAFYSLHDEERKRFIHVLYITPDASAPLLKRFLVYFSATKEETHTSKMEAHKITDMRVMQQQRLLLFQLGEEMQLGLPIRIQPCVPACVDHQGRPAMQIVQVSALQKEYMPHLSIQGNGGVDLQLLDPVELTLDASVL